MPSCSARRPRRDEEGAADIKGDSVCGGGGDDDDDYY